LIRKAKKLNMLNLILDEKSLIEEKGDVLNQIRKTHEEELRKSDFLKEKEKHLNAMQNKGIKTNNINTDFKKDGRFENISTFYLLTIIFRNRCV
jgi:hypothetical protein